MISTGRIVMLFAGVFCGIASFVPRAQAAQTDYLSPSALVADGPGQTLYIAEETANLIAVFDVASGAVKKTISLPDRPSGLALAPDGGTLYVTIGAPNGIISVVNLREGKAVAEMNAEHTPNAPVVSPDGKTLYVCNRFTNNVAVYDLPSKEITATIEVPREPFAAAITPDGKTLFVAHLIPGGAADGDYVAAGVSVIDTTAKKLEKAIQLPNGSVGLRDICLSPDGKFAYVTHVLARYQLPTTQLERGWMNTNALSIIDTAQKKLANTVLLDDVDLGGANPWGVRCTADGKYVCVAHAGTHQISVIDREKLHEKLARAAAGEKVSDATSSYDDVPNDLSFLVGLRRRINLTGNGPRGLALIGTNAYAAEYFTDTLGLVDIDPDVRPAAKSLALGPEKQLTEMRKGQMFFNDANLCFQKWQSCSSCHPGEARPDGLNWDLLNDGLGNPKNTKSMLLAHQTPPCMATGVRETAEVAVRAGIRHIQFAVRPEADAAAIDEYLKLLKPTPSPYLKEDRLRAAAKRGQEIFENANCASCHPAPLYTDMKEYNIGTGRDREKDTLFDTPTLIEVWRTAPYLHDGRAATMKDLLTRHNSDDKHGQTSGLTDAQINDLALFVLSL
ncbi:MAG: beta-propeller fold lactonase family protein [Sedimentisphaerales bacterium]|nr:beta-propeller fold lactonase family protein [Sedimentisphaerales bacterium]